MRQRTRTVRPWAIVLWLLIWQVGAMVLQSVYPHGALLIASPIAVLKRLFALVCTSAFWRAALTSTAHILGGFLLSSVLAILIAALSARYARVCELIAPIVTVIKAVPIASFIILALIWVSGESLAFFISALIVFPPVYLSTLEGVRHADRSLLEMAHVFRVPLLRRLRGIYIPQVLPHFRAAARTALGLCWKAGIAAEVIGLCGGTIGERLYNAKIYFQTPDLFAWTAMIVLLSAVFERLFLHAVDRLAERMGI